MMTLIDLIIVVFNFLQSSFQITEIDQLYNLMNKCNIPRTEQYFLCLEIKQLGSDGEDEEELDILQANRILNQVVSSWFGVSGGGHGGMHVVTCSNDRAIVRVVPASQAAKLLAPLSMSTVNLADIEKEYSVRILDHSPSLFGLA